MQRVLGETVDRLRLIYSGMKIKTYRGRKSPHMRKIWLVQCICLNIKEVMDHSLKSGDTKSCGCLQWENLGKRHQFNPKIHDIDHPEKRYSVEYNLWLNIRGRCSNPNHPSYKGYGGRGIRICPQWECSFELFFEHVGKSPGPGYSLDRIDNDGNYEPGNVRWATAKVQGRNTRKNVLITMNDNTFTLAEWSEITGINALTIKYRIDHEWTIERALTEKPPCNRTGFKGVFRTPYNRFYARSAGHYLGRFETAEDAATAYNVAARSRLHKSLCVGRG